MKIKWLPFLVLFISVINASVIAQNKAIESYAKYIDSANNHIDNRPKLASTFLDSIPKPINQNITGKIADYYYLKAVISNQLNQQAEVYHYNILALKHAEKEEKYDIAGSASLELFYNLYLVRKDSVAFDYLKKAQKFYNLENDQNGLTEVMQMGAFVEFYNNNYKKSNALIESKLDHYKSIKSDQYYYMYALYMLITNYIHLNDELNYSAYFNKFKNLEHDTTISPYLYKKHKVTLYNSMAERYLNNKLLVSGQLYLNKAGTMRAYMNDSDIEDFYKNHITYFNISNNLKMKSNYIDSLKIFQQNLIHETVDASFNINESLIETVQSLEEETDKKYANRNWIIILVVLLLGFVAFVLARYKHIKNLLNDFSKRKEEYSFLQNNHERLKVKLKGMEGYLSDVKKEIKNISRINDKNNQHYRVKELYKNLHHNSATLLSKSENHLELICDLNVEFFNELSNKHPNLNASEVITCYYLFMGFKSKEIAVFLNTSTRAIESKRYRISNKLDVKSLGLNLTDYLTNSFQLEVDS
ncbi:helix-turn-helix transcriptional regulator [Algibacter sp. PT7-4]|uniref:helix-turn-helix transcriptional regulator n=1 Tax=Algibacter ulvanivorans TaxID=3400999 RepID=UPI003AAA4398